MSNKSFNSLKATAAAITDWKQVEQQSSKNPEAWASAEDFLGKDLSAIEPGKYNLGGGAYACVSEYVTKDSNKWEYHEKFIDVQFVVKGKEQIGIAPINNAINHIGVFDPEKDCGLFESAESAEMVTMTPDGFFTILFPNEAHCPCLKAETNTEVKKVVVKIPYVK